MYLFFFNIGGTSFTHNERRPVSSLVAWWIPMVVLSASTSHETSRQRFGFGEPFLESFIVKDGKISLLKVGGFGPFQSEMVEFTFIFVPRKYDFLLKPPSSTTKLPYTKTPSLPISAVFRVFCQRVTSTVAGRHFLDLFHHPCCVSWLHWGNAANICNQNRRRQPASYLEKHWWDVVFGRWDWWRGSLP